MNTWTVLKSFLTKKLPHNCDFFSFLKDECMSKTEYSHAINVWNTFKTNIMGDYHYFYLNADILLLANVFESLLIGV